MNGLPDIRTFGSMYLLISKQLEVGPVHRRKAPKEVFVACLQCLACCFPLPSSGELDDGHVPIFGCSQFLPDVRK